MHNFGSSVQTTKHISTELTQHVFGVQMYARETISEYFKNQPQFFNNSKIDFL